MIQESYEPICSSQLLDTLCSIAKSNNNCLIKTAEKQLYKLQKYPDYLTQVISVLPLSSIPLKARRLAAVFVMLYIRNRKQRMTREQGKEVLQMIVDCFDNRDIDWWIKVYLAEATQVLVKSQQNKALNQILCNRLTTALGVIENQSLESLRIDYIALTGPAVVQFINRNKTTINQTQIYQKLLALTIKLQQQLLQHLQKELTADLEAFTQRLEKLVSLLSITIRTHRKGQNIIKVSSYAGQTTENKALIAQTLFNGLLMAKQSKLNPRLWIQRSNQGIVKALNSLRISYLKLMADTLQHIILEGVCHTSEIYLMGERIIVDIIQGLCELMQGKRFHYQYSPKLDEVIQEQLTILIVASKDLTFRPIIYQKHIILLRTIYKLVDFSKEDFNQFYLQPNLFINHLIAIIDAKITLTTNNQHQTDKEIEEETIQVKAAILFKLIIHMDPRIAFQVGTEIILQIGKRLADNQLPLQLMLIVNLIRDYVSPFEILVHQIGKLALSITHRPLTTIMALNPKQNVNYALCLATLSSYLKIINSLWPDFVKNILILALQLISEKLFCEGHRILGEMLIQDILSIHSEDPILLEQLLTEINNRIEYHTKQASLTQNLLDSLYFVMQQLIVNERALQIISQTKIQIIEGIINCMAFCIEKEIKKVSYSKSFLNKAWNVVRLVGENQVLSMGLLPALERLVGNCVEHLSSQRKLDFEEDCFLLMTSFIQYSQKVSNFVVALFRLIPSIFYGEYRGNFGHSFQALQMIVYYGIDILKDPSNHIFDSILKMSLESMTGYGQADSCEGVLLLHSVFLSEASSLISPYKLTAIIDMAKSLLRKNKKSFNLTASLTVLFGLCIRKASIEMVEPCDVNSFMQLCHQQCLRCDNLYTLKGLIFSCCQILLTHELRYCLPSANLIRQILSKSGSICKLPSSSREIAAVEIKEKQFNILTMVLINKLTKIKFNKYLSSFRESLRGLIEAQPEYLSLLEVIGQMEETVLEKQKQFESNEREMLRREGKHWRSDVF